jgi:hypothetical protein
MLMRCWLLIGGWFAAEQLSGRQKFFPGTDSMAQCLTGDCAIEYMCCLVGFMPQM